MTNIDRIDENQDTPDLAEEEINQALIANIPLSDLAKYVADRIRLRNSGATCYIRKKPMSPQRRKEEIKRKFSGKNISELAKEYDLTTKRIRQIISGK